MKNKNLVCYLSEKGHKNFWYPTETKAIIQNACNLEKLNYVHGGTRQLCALRVLKSCLLPINFDSCSVDNISPPQEDEYVVVWVERHAIKINTNKKEM
tara:strand:+ start:137 stop:430 length:294 start_codon:yes stop_codon:yes gene_type:complete